VNTISDHPKFILINSASLHTISKDEYLKHHFSFILNFSSGLGGYNFDCKDKSMLAKLFHLSGKKILAIGKSIDNFKLFYESDFSVLADHSSTPICKPEIRTKSLLPLVKFLIFES
jgi:hypothetical protein